MPPVPAVRPVLSLCPASQARARSAGPLEDDFSPAELAEWGALKSEKRRLDWLAGRLAGKEAAREWLSRNGERVSGRVEIFNGAEGAPYIKADSGSVLARLARISLSHCDFGGVAAAHGAAVGVDAERIAPRDSGVLAHYARADENASTPELATRLWTVKEAALKALGLGFAGGLLNVHWSGGTDLNFFGAAEQRRLSLELGGFAVESWIEGETAFGLVYQQEALP